MTSSNSDSSSVPAVPINSSSSAAERWTHIIQQASLCGRQLRRLLAHHIARWNITDTEFLLLWSCHHVEDRHPAQHELASMLGVSAAQMSGMIYDLRDRGLLSFERTERDRRRQELRITGAGRMMLSKILDDLGPLADLLEQQFNEHEQQLAEQLLERLSLVGQAPPSGETHLRRAS